MQSMLQAVSSSFPHTMRELFQLRYRLKHVRRAGLPFFFFLAVLFMLPAHSAQAQTFGCSPAMANDIVCENSKTGSPSSNWDISGAGDSTIQGFGTDISVNQGSTINFKISTPARAYTITIFRLGYYQGNGARQIATVTPSAPLPQTQPACITDAPTHLYDCGNWAVSASWQVPPNATSGVYLALLKRTDTGGVNHIIFIVRNDGSHSNILFKTLDETWQAYNAYGGHSVYGQADTWDLPNRAYKVSYNRPFITRGFSSESATWVFGAEYPMIRWLESNGYDVTYFTGVDAARNGSLIQNHKILMDSGHDEYWSGPERSNVEGARDAGVNMAFFSGNEIFWKTRWENSIDGTNTSYRTMVVYKETLAFAKIDPADPPTWTGTWRDPSFSPPADGGRPENALTGTLFMVNQGGSDNTGNQSIKVPAADGKMRFWRNTSIASLSSGQTSTLPAGTLGYEWDADIDNGWRPAGLFDLSTATYTMTTDLLLDYGATYGAGSITHHMTTYRAPSGALVFGAGTVQWSWGLDSTHDNPFFGPNLAASKDMQQATVNLFADMGVQPASLQGGLLPALSSSDTIPPASTITSPATGSTVTLGTPITITGTASDGGGGVVAGTEVSIDGGVTWHPAPGRGSWSYSWTPSALGTVVLKSRAVDDSGNIETPSGISITVGPRSCPCTVWNSSVAPANVDDGDPHATNLGVKFRVDTNGLISGIRFYKASTNTGTHIGSLWSRTGTLLGSVTFTNETGSGWQQANFTTPIAVTANTTYVASYFAPKGHYSEDDGFFASSGVDFPPMHLLEDGVDGVNGVYVYGSTTAFPTLAWLSANYYVDVVYTSAGSSITGNVGPASLASGTTLTLSGQSTATATADSSGNYTFSGLSNGTYTVTPSKSGLTFTPPSQTVTINNNNATLNFSVQTWSISGTVTGANGATLALTGAANAVTTADASGNFTFSGLVNGAYTVTPSGSGSTFNPVNQSVTVSGANITAVNFTATPVPTYSISGTVSPSGNGTVLTLSGTSTGTATADGSGNYTFAGLQNGSYTVTPSKSGFTFTPASQSVTISGANMTSVNFTTAVATTFSISGTVNPNLAGSGTLLTLSGGASGTVTADTSGNYSFGGLLNGTYTVTPSKSGYTFSPANQTVTINGGSFSAINFTIAETLFTTQTPAIPNDTDGPGINYELGTVFTSGASGSVTAIRFWKSANETGTHTGNLWSSSGQLLASVTFTNETASGWQQQALSIPVAISASTQYVVSVNTGNAFYSDTTSGLASQVVNHDLATVVGNNGLYGSPGAFPTSTFSNTNYFRDLVFVPGQAYTISGTVSPSGSGTVLTLSGASTGTATADGSGNYTFTGLQNGSYTVTPSNSGFTFTPANQLVTINGANATSVNFTATPIPTYSISGTVSPSGSGTVLTLSGASTGTATADGSGNYTFTGLQNGSYTVTPSKSGFTFTPANQPLTINGASATSVNFTATPIPTYSISGTVSPSGSGTVLTLSGTSTGTATADGSGNYTFAGLQNGSYTVTPSKGGFTFTPANQPLTINGASATSVNFTATPIPTFSISGTISPTAAGSGATVKATGTATASVTADASGNYTITGLLNGTYTITPSQSGYTFTPASQPETISGASITGVNFTGQVSTGSPIAIDVNTSTDGTQATTVKSAAFTITKPNELLLAFVATDQASAPAMTVTGVTGGSLTWALVVRTNTQKGTSEIWRAFSSTTLSNVTVTATLSQSVVSSITVMTFSGVNTSGTNGSGAIGAVKSGSGSSGGPTATLVTTQNNSWVFGVGNDYDNAIAHTVGPNQTMVHQDLASSGDTYWVQRQNSATPLSGTSVTINDTAPTTDRYNFSICEILQAP